MPNYAETQDHFIETMSGSRTMASMHYHSSYELYYLEAGRREYFVEDTFFSVSAGSFVLIPPSKFHRTGGAYAQRTLVGFTSEFLMKTYTPETVEELLGCFDKLLITPPKESREMFRFLLKALARCTDGTEFAVYLGALLRELSKCSPEQTGDEQISRIIQFINEHYAELHSIEQIASHFYISKYHLCRIFKNSMSITVIEYLNQIRIKNACSQMESGDRSILEIAQGCGFNSSAYFSSVFKKITGVSPSEYRRKKRGERIGL